MLARQRTLELASELEALRNELGRLEGITRSHNETLRYWHNEVSRRDAELEVLRAAQPAMVARIAALEEALNQRIDIEVTGLSMKEYLTLQERKYIRKAVQLHNGNVRAAAKALDVSIATLYRRCPRLHHTIAAMEKSQ